MIVGEAHVVVRAITTDVERQIRNMFDGIDKVGERAGRDLSEGMSRGMGRGGGSPLTKAFSSMESATDSARRTFDALIVSSYTLGPAIVGVVGAVSSLVGALGALVGMAAAALPALGALGGAFGALIQAGITLKLAFSGVAAAIQAGTKAKKADEASSKKQKKDLTSYIRSLYDAKLALARLRRDNAREEADANAKLKETQADLLNQELENAQKITEAKRDIEGAQTALTAAYEAGAEALQQLNFDAEDAALAEKRAALELDKARETLLRVQDLPPNSRARREAELAYAQADLNYRKAIDNNKDTAKAADKANAAGVDGTNEVIDAQNDLINAQNKLAEAERKQAQDAADGLNKIMEAQQDLIDVIIKNGEQEEDAVLRVKRAREDLAKARAKGDTAAQTAANAYAASMEGLSKEQKDFVRFMVDTFIPSIDKLKAAAGREFFPKLIDAMTKIKDDLFPKLVPLLETTGGKLGDVAIKIADAITKTGAIEKIKKIWEANDVIIEKFGNIAADTIGIILRLLEAVIPLTERFVGWIEKGADKFNKFLNRDKSIKELEGFFNRAGDIMAAFGDIFGNLFGGLNNIILGLMEPGSGGWMLLEFFQDVTKKFENWTGTAKGKNDIAKYFKDVAGNAIEIMKALGPLIGILAKMGADPAIGEFAKKMQNPELLASIESIIQKFSDAGPIIGDFIISAAKFFDLTMDAGAIQTFWNTLKDVADVLIGFFENPVVKKAFATIAQIAAALVALRLAWSLLKIPILAIANPLVKIGKGFSLLHSLFTGPGGLAVQFASKFPLLATLTAASGPILLVTAAVAGLVAAFVAMWNESEIFREAIKKLIDGVIAKAVEIFERLKKKLEEALKPLGGTKGVVDKLKVAFKWLGDVIGKYVIPFVEGGLKNALEIIGAVFGTIIDTIGNVIEAIMGIIDAVKAGDWKGVFENIVNLITAPFRALGSNLIDLVKNIFTNMIDAVKKVLGIASPSKVFVDIAKDIMMGLINGFKALATFLFDTFLAPFKKVFAWFTTTALPWFQKLPGEVVKAVAKLWDFFINLLATAWLKVTGWWDSTGKKFFQDLPGKLLNWAGKLWNFLGDKISEGWKTVTDFFGPTGTVATFIRGLGGKIALWAKGMWEGLKSGMVGVVNWIIARLNNIIDVFNLVLRGIDRLPPPAPDMKTQFTRLTPIAMALGGTVFPTTGGTLARIAEAGRPERVEPLDPDGLSKRDKAMIALLAGGAGGGTTINVYGTPGMDVNELAKAVNREIAFQMRMGAA